MRGPRARSYRGTWDMSASGQLHPGEDPLEGAVREYKEEMGAMPVPLVVLRTLTWVAPPPGSKNSRFTAYLAETEEEYFPEPPDKGVVANWGWYTQTEMVKLDLHPVFAQEIPYLIDRLV